MLSERVPLEGFTENFWSMDRRAPPPFPEAMDNGSKIGRLKSADVAVEEENAEPAEDAEAEVEAADCAVVPGLDVLLGEEAA